MDQPETSNDGVAVESNGHQMEIDAGEDSSTSIQPDLEGAGIKRKNAESTADSANEDSDDDVAKKAKLLPVPSKLPDLDKYWTPVKEDPKNFSAWTYLLQYVDQESEIEAARMAYDQFLAYYPNCYGYWRKYADYERSKGTIEMCEKVFERGLKAIPLSVDLWIHYLSYVKTSAEDRAKEQSNGDDADAGEEYIRSQYERALDECGLEFRSDKLWEAYIAWETEAKRFARVLKIYDRLLATPTISYNGHFEKFSELVNSAEVSVDQLLSADELAAIKADVEQPEVDKKEEEGGDKETKPDDIDQLMRQKILEQREAVHKANQQAVTARWTFEVAIKRPYFHVKPLERCQLKNWRDYLDFEVAQGDAERIRILYERCLIACALYDEFWIKLVNYYEGQLSDAEGAQLDLLIERTRNVYERACTIHHPDSSALHLKWASFEELQGNEDRAVELLESFEKRQESTEVLLQVAFHRINVERRRQQVGECEALFERYLALTKSDSAACCLFIKYARFVHKFNGDLERAMGILKRAHERDPKNSRICLQRIDLAMQRPTVSEQEVTSIIDEFVQQEGVPSDQIVLFARRKVEFLEDFGSIRELRLAQRYLGKCQEKQAEEKKTTEELNDKNKETKKAKEPAEVAQQATTVAAAPLYGNASYTNPTWAAVADPTAATYAAAYTDTNYNWNHQYGGYPNVGANTTGGTYGSYY